MAGKGRPAKPAVLHIIDGSKRFSKRELEERKDLEIKLGETDSKFSCPPWVKKDAVAYSKWKECIKIYEDHKTLELVSTSDIGHLGRYCKTFAEYLNLVEHRKAIADIDIRSIFTQEEEGEIIGEFEEHAGKKQAVLMWKRVDYVLSLNGLQAIDKSINQKMAALIAMEDRLFLNPLAKIKAIPKGSNKKRSTPKADPLEQFEGL